MKNIKLVRLLALLMALLTLATLAFASCANANVQGEVETKESSDTTAATTKAETGAQTTAQTDAETTAKPEYDTITIAEAIKLCGTESGYVTTDRYYIRATIKSVTNRQYGSMIIEDETGSISVYGTYGGADGEIFYPDLEYVPVKGDEVLLHCILQNFNGNPEVKNARLIDYKNNQGAIDLSAYTSATIEEARAAEKGANLKVDGVVARITFANGMKPSGFILVDETSSIYVYDGDAAQNVKIGNKVEVAGTKDYWILDTETGNAAKHGYKGCNQLADVTLVSNDNKTDNAFDTSWITETTVKDILETPVTEDITTKIFKVNALVKKVPGSGFTNYYFNDLDGKTGSYTYTQCNGNDFAWLDEFDGEICTVYLMALNAKSTSSECVYRFLPVAVKDEGFEFDTANTAQHVMDYYAVDQFLTTYTGNPQLELVTSVSSELLGFENATISYSSSNTESVRFTEVDGKTILECLDPGAAIVTITVNYDGNAPAVKTLEITVGTVDAHGCTVEEAIDAELNATVVVEGIVGPSLVNRDGFYLIDDTGVIAVVVKDSSVWEGLAIGQKVVLEGMRDKFHNGEGDHAGQIALTGVTVKANYYGNQAYDTSTFITGKTLADFYALDVKEDHSTEVYVLKATISVNETAYYTNIKITSGATSITLYSSSASQYNFLKAFANQEVTMELAPCNWNNKTYYAGCVLAVYTDGGKVMNTHNFQG